MECFKINYYLQKIKKSKTYNFILISVSWNKQRVRTTLKIHVEENLWDAKKQRAKASSKNPQLINSKLDEIRNVMNKMYEDIEKDHKRPPTLREVKLHLDAVIHNKAIKPSKKREPKKQKQIIEHFNDFINDTKSGVRLSANGKKISESTIITYNTTLNHLEPFLKSLKTSISFDDIDENFFAGLTKHFSKLNLSNNYQGLLFKVIKSFMHYTFDKGLHSNSRFMKALKVFKEDTVKVALDQAELLRIESLTDLSDRLEKIKDLFLIQIYTGLRFSDLSNLKPENINYTDRVISIYSVKTKTPLTIPTMTRLETILKKYNGILPRLSGQKYNDGLKELCQLAEINTPIQTTRYVGNKRIDETNPKFKLVTSHTARRTFITLTLKSGVMEDMIMKISGHKNKASFQNYVRIQEDEALNEVRKAWGE